MVGVPLNLERMEQNLSNYDKEKYREMILEASEIVLGFLGFDRNVYSGNFNKRDRVRRTWYEELREERIKDIQDEMAEK